MRGPDLTAVGAEPEHTADWLAAHVRDPKAHKPDSRRPAFGPEKIPDADLQALAAYLAGRK
jgi:cbb3-type cytochrome oxidase cytochrome c subunit